MLYDEFNSFKNFAGADVFKNKATEKKDILNNLNPTFIPREYQKEALGRFYYYCEEYHQKIKPIHLMFNMATGSGKTLIMAANILYFYQKGYRNFIFFTRLGNIIQKTKANFLDPNSKKYLFANKIVSDGKEVKIKEVDNFEGVNNNDINIIFTTISNLHNRFNSAKENAITYEDFVDKKVVLLGDEAHNFQAQTTTEIENEKNTWEKTILGNSRDLFNTPGILNANREKDNVLLEYTATARLDEPTIAEKYKDKAIYRYDLKEFRLDGFSKEVSTKQIDAPLMERVLAAVVISQYRLKVAEKHKIDLKPVILFKANQVNPPRDVSKLKGDNPTVVLSGKFKEKFHQIISSLSADDLEKISTIKETSEHKILNEAFKFFETKKITLANLADEIKSDFAPDKCLTVDEDKDLEQKQILLNSLENSDNGIRAIFATEKLNEGWDVLNLFDIVRLYNSRDARSNRPGKTTVQEAQLIGRGARYYPFSIGEYTDKYRRKFDNMPEEELKILEHLYYHSMHNPDYISELKKALVETGIIAERNKKYDISIKPEFMKTDFWKTGFVFINSQEPKDNSKVNNLKEAKAEFDNNNEGNVYKLPTRSSQEEFVYIENTQEIDQQQTTTKEVSFVGTVGVHIVRSALGHFSLGNFENLRKVFGSLESISDFINNTKYLSSIKVKVQGKKSQINNLTQKEKLDLAVFVLKKVFEEAGKNKKEFQGSRFFKCKLIKNVFPEKKTLLLDEKSPRAQSMNNFNFQTENWFAQNEIWGTNIEEKLLLFIRGFIEKLADKYEEIALLRNEQFFKIYNFSDGEAFAPDFVFLLKENKIDKKIIYQVFIEPKNETLAKAEPWKEEFLLEIKKEYKTDLDLIKYNDKDFKLLGLPFFNESTMQQFEEVFKNELL